VQTVALIGNPNSGKSSLFNILAGMRQKVGNYPGVTVDVKSAVVELTRGQKVTLVDMPGLYSMYPAGMDEQVVVDILMDRGHKHHPDVIIYTIDASHLEAQLLLLTQLRDMGFPLVLAVNMSDEIERSNITIDTKQLSSNLGVPVIPVSSRTGINISQLQNAVIGELAQSSPVGEAFYHIPSNFVKNVEFVFNGSDESNIYIKLLRMHHDARRHLLNSSERERFEKIISEEEFHALAAQVDETMERADKIKWMLSGVVKSAAGFRGTTDKLDRILTHKFFGPIIFAVVMVFVFQAIFAWAVYPMDWIEGGFAWLSSQLSGVLPHGWFSSLITDGLIAGLSGVLVFVPQIAILFFLITILEEVGYMARAVYLFDRLLRRFGMNGRSIVALISGGACAIPAIMSTRTIENWKERLITIMVTPFISCSARIPVFALLVAFVVPYQRVWGIFNSQGLAFTGLYVIGVVAAVLSGYVFKKILKAKSPSFLLLELPVYRFPDWTNVWIQVRSKSGAFVKEAGKIIIMISLALWFLASFGPTKEMQLAESQAQAEAVERKLSDHETADLIAAKKLEVSYAGHLGKVFEPIIRPLGYDWKIGIALITSFAAREVFVGSMATIYSVGSDDDTLRIRERLKSVKDPTTGEPVFTSAVALSLLLFFLLAMQCMSTLAVVRKETGTWKWPVIQFTFMTVLAYVVSFIAYQVAS